MPSTVQVERGQFGLVEAWIMENGAAFIRVSETCPIITYTAAPARRIALREYMLSEGISHLTELQRGGVINSHQVFFSRYVDNETWDMMLVVLFPQATDIGRWRQVEVQSPAALSSRGLAEVQSVSTTSVVRVRSFEPARKSPDSVFLVIPYKVLIPTPDYLSYFNGYVLPQLDGWREQKVLIGYNLYMAQYPAGERGPRCLFYDTQTRPL